ncbi:MAG: hypothetical protein ABJB10_09490, partial [Mesorhizobium sp.]
GDHAPIEDKGILTEHRCRQRCGRSQQHIDVLKNRAHLIPPPSTEPLGLKIPGGWRKRAGEQSITDGRIEIGRTAAQTTEVKLAAFAGSDEVGGSACNLRIGQLHPPFGSKGLGDFRHRSMDRRLTAFVEMGIQLAEIEALR